MTWTRLHDACENLDKQRILDRCRLEPKSLLEVDDRGQKPLHILSFGNPDPTLLQTLIDSCPAAITDKDVHGDTALHVAASYPGTDLQIVKTLLDSCPTLTGVTNKEGLMPLHSACRFAPQNEAVIEYLIQVYPSALRCRIKMGNPAPPRKRTSTRKNQQQQQQPRKATAESSSSSSSSSLHFVTPQVGTNYGEIRFQSLSTQIRDGAYPLHMAIKAGATKSVLEMLINGDDDVLLMCNKYGETPLHVALTVPHAEYQDEIIELLVNHHPQSCGKNALKLKDKRQQKNLPIHVAAIHGCSVRVAHALLQHDDDLASMIHEVNGDWKTAYDLAMDSRKCDEAVLRLLKGKGKNSE